MINIKVEINVTENRNIMQKFKETISWFFGKINKMYKPLARLPRDRETERQRQRGKT